MGTPGERARSAIAGRRLALACVALLLVAAGCVGVGPGLSSNDGGDRLHVQARAALARWADAAGGKQGIAFVGDLTGQIGDWEEQVGGNNKIALMSGLIRPGVGLATQTPAPANVTWADGTSTAVDLISAAQALDQIVKSAGSTCSDCRALEVTAARLTSGSVETSRGPATAPVWEFTIQGTGVKVTRVAVAGGTSVVPPPWDPNDAPEGISIDSASGAPDATHLTVSFVGAPDGADRPCGADYSAEAVESTLAIVVIVVEHRNLTAGACLLVGAVRTADVTLASPLADRTVLEIKQGLPVPLVAP
jgi:hypothetical protein